MLNPGTGIKSADKFEMETLWEGKREQERINGNTEGMNELNGKRNCESYVSGAIWHGDVGCTGKRKLYENIGKTGSWTVCCYRAEKVHGRERMETNHSTRKITWCSYKRGKIEQHGDIQRKRNLHTDVQRVMKTDSSAGWEQEGRSNDWGDRKSVV